MPFHLMSRDLFSEHCLPQRGNICMDFDSTLACQAYNLHIDFAAGKLIMTLFFLWFLCALSKWWLSNLAPLTLCHHSSSGNRGDHECEKVMVSVQWICLSPIITVLNLRMVLLSELFLSYHPFRKTEFLNPN